MFATFLCQVNTKKIYHIQKVQIILFILLLRARLVQKQTKGNKNKKKESINAMLTQKEWFFFGCMLSPSTRMHAFSRLYVLVSEHYCLYS